MNRRRNLTTPTSWMKAQQTLSQYLNKKKIIKDGGVRNKQIINFCSLSNILVGNSYFQCKHNHKYTRKKPNRGKTSIIDILIVEKIMLKIIYIQWIQNVFTSTGISCIQVTLTPLYICYLLTCRQYNIEVSMEIYRFRNEVSIIFTTKL